MTSQFLTLRIKSILDGKSDISLSEKRVVATEYRRLTQNIELRLLHCASLIKAGREYMALQVAEAEPPLLESLNELSMTDIEKWKSFCFSEGLSLPIEFDSYQVGLVNALYKKEISQTHTLYRDFRRAMRLHDKDKALNVIKTIIKININNSEAKAEFEKLKKSIIIRDFELAKVALANNNLNTVFNLVTKIESLGDEIISDDIEWKKLLEIRDKEKSSVIRGILKELSEKIEDMNPEENYVQISSLSSEYNILKYENNLEDLHGNKAKSNIEIATRILSEKQKTEDEKKVKNSLIAELDGNSKESPIVVKNRLKKLLALSPNLESDLKRNVNRKIFKLTCRVYGKLMLTSVLVSCLAIIIVVSGYLYYKDSMMKNILSESNKDLQAIFKSPNIEIMRDRIKSFENKYSNFIHSGELSQKISIINDEYTNRKFVFDRTQKIMDDLSSYLDKDLSSADWTNLISRLDDIDRELEKFKANDKVLIADKYNELRRLILNRLDDKKRERKEVIAKHLDDLENFITSYENSQGADTKNLDIKINTTFDSLKPLIEDSSKFFSCHELDRERFNSYSERFITARRSSIILDEIKIEMSRSKNFSEYFSALEKYSRLKILPERQITSAKTILKLKDYIIDNVYGGLCPIDIAAKADEIKFSFTPLKYPNNGMIGNVYRYLKNKKPIYTVGLAIDKNKSWKGGSEQIQEVQEIGIGGRITQATYRIFILDGKSARGERLLDPSITKESILANEVLKMSQREPLLKVLNFIAKSPANPALKLWLEIQIYNTMESDPIKSGLIFSPKLKARIKSVMSYSGELADYTWIFATPSKLTLWDLEFYKEDLPNYYELAEIEKKRVSERYKNPLRYIGFVSCDGKYSLQTGDIKNIFGISAVKIFEELKLDDPTSAEIFTPVFTKENK